MEIYTMTHPSMLLTAACTLSAVSPVAAAAPVAAPVMAALRAPISPMQAPIAGVYQVQFQAELAVTNGRIDGVNGTTGFLGLSGSVDSKRFVDERGVPPRGRPV